MNSASPELNAMLVCVDDQCFTQWLPNIPAPPEVLFLVLGPPAQSVSVYTSVDKTDCFLNSYKAGCCVEEPTHAFQSFPGLCSGLGHPSAHLFACELRVYAIRSEVVAASSRSSKGCRQVRCKFVVSLKLSEAYLDTGSVRPHSATRRST